MLIEISAEAWCEMRKSKTGQASQEQACLPATPSTPLHQMLHDYKEEDSASQPPVSTSVLACGHAHYSNEPFPRCNNKRRGEGLIGHDRIAQPPPPFHGSPGH